MILKALTLLFHFTLIFPHSLWAQEPHPINAEFFLKQMTSETVTLLERPEIKNHYYKSPKMEPTAIVFVPGMGEPALKYSELAKDLSPLHATLYMWDHIGQGFSSHLLPQETAKTHIDSFETHLLALENFVGLLKKQHKAIYVIGHSMGGHISLRLALKHPGWIDRLALSSPLIDLNYKTFPVKSLLWILRYLPGEWYPPLYFLFKEDGKKENHITHSQERVHDFDELVKKYPEIKRDGATMGWILSAVDSISKLKKEDKESLTLPVLLLQAQEDVLVSTQAQKQICQELKNCKSFVINGAYHELLFEKDPARKTAIESILKFLKP